MKKNLFNNTNLLEVRRLEVYIFLEDLLSSDKNNVDNARQKLAEEIILQLKKLETYKNEKVLIPKYLTKEDNSLPSIYLISSNSEWYRLRLQHDYGPVVTEPEYVESYCSTFRPSLVLLAQVIEGYHKHQIVLDRKGLDTLITKIGAILPGYDCDNEFHIEIYYDRLPTAENSQVVDSHLSGGTLRKIQKITSESMITYNDNGKEVFINLHDSIVLIENFWNDIKSLIQSDNNPSDFTKGIRYLQTYCNRKKQATLPYNRRCKKSWR